MLTVEDHLERHLSGPLTPPDNMMGRVIAKHTPMRGNGEPLDLARVDRHVYVHVFSKQRSCPDHAGATPPRPPTPYAPVGGIAPLLDRLDGLRP